MRAPCAGPPLLGRPRAREPLGLQGPVSTHSRINNARDAVFGMRSQRAKANRAPAPLTRSTPITASRQVECVGVGYLVTTQRVPRADTAAPPWDRRAEECAALAALAHRMTAAARRALAGSGLEMRAGLAAGPAVAAVLGSARRRLRLVGGAAARAGGLCGAARPWQASLRPRAALSSHPAVLSDCGAIAPCCTRIPAIVS